MWYENSHEDGEIVQGSFQYYREENYRATMLTCAE